jgi:hypothetical protein
VYVFKNTPTLREDMPMSLRKKNMKRGESLKRKMTNKRRKDKS